MKLIKNWRMSLIITSMIICAINGCYSPVILGKDESIIKTVVCEANYAAYNEAIITTVLDCINNTTNTSELIKVKSNNEKYPLINTITNGSGSIVIIDFGPDEIMSKTGFYFRGKIYCTNTVKPDENGCVTKIYFENFYINSNQIHSRKTITYKGLNTSNNKYWIISSADTIINSDNIEATWKSTRTRTLIDNGNTSDEFFDDTYQITGRATGKRPNEVYFILTTNDSVPLIYHSNHSYFTQGLTNVSSENRNIKTDYGTGTYDNTITININNTQREFNLSN